MQYARTSAAIMTRGRLAGLKPKIKVAFASGTDELNARLVARMREVFPELPLYVVSEFRPAESGLIWVRYRGGLRENLARCRSSFYGKSIRLAGVLLVPAVPFRRMRLLALILAPFYFLAINENLNDFMLRPGLSIARHLFWRLRNFVRWHAGKSGFTAQRSWSDLPYIAAWIAGYFRIAYRRRKPSLASATVPPPAALSPDDSAALERAFRETPELFCATLGPNQHGAALQYRLRANIGGSLFDDEKVCQLGGLDATFDTPELQYLDLCYRAWQRGWPTVSIGESTAADSLDDPQFLARTVSDPKVFRQLWARALKKLHAEAGQSAVARKALRHAPAAALAGGPAVKGEFPEELFLALADGSSTVYAGKAPTGKPRVLVASAYLPFPLTHGGAVRIHNLTARVAANWDQILVCFTETDAPPPPELLERFVEVALVRRVGSHMAVRSERPEVVEEFASDAFRAILQLTVRKWKPAIAQLEFTHMAQYAADCAPARTILVEHDITFDLYQQLAKDNADWDLRREVKRWRTFETAAWREMACVVTMSAKDQALVTGTRSLALPNGVDLDRFRVATSEPEPRRILFVGSFSHLPNVLALTFFLEEAWPRLRSLAPDARLHIIAGSNHEYFLEHHGAQVQISLNQSGVEIEGFVSDVRSAYARATVVIAPLVASAGTNLKILEAMACGRPVVSTPAGVNGLDLVPDRDFVLVRTGAEMADAVARLFASPNECRRLAAAGRKRVEEAYGWDEIARRQTVLYRELTAR
jgi:glycosyltransferase involved in cell wall biosynthesis